MNVERWLKARTPSWQRLEQLLARVDKGGTASLNHQDLRELGRLYRVISSDLSRARAMKISQDVQVYLNNLVVKAHNQVYQTRGNRWAALFKFLWVGFPQLVRQYIVYVSLSFALFSVFLVMSYAFVQQDIHFAQMEMIKGQPLLPESLWDTIEKQRMWTDADEHYSATVSSLIATNNLRVAIMAFALGITFGIGTSIVLCQNGLLIGTVLGVCKTYGMAGRLLAFVAPHGVLELTAIFISGGAGLLLGKALLFPGQYKRLDALKLVARDAGGLFGGCIPILLVAGLIEGFISPRTDLPAEMKYFVSLSTLFCLLLYLFVPRGSTEKPTTEGELGKSSGELDKSPAH